MKEKTTLEETLMDTFPSSSKQTNFGKYHVFLSFRGPDTRNNFTAHLHERLVTFGFDVYKDDKEMIKGEGISEDLKRAISNSRICIPIFSHTYASSKACLYELCHMIENKIKIIPIFYDVTPDDVKLKTPLYRSALEEHRHDSKIEMDEVDKWKNALVIAANKAGFDIANKNEAQEITSITQELVNQLMPKYQDVTSHLVEIDNEMHCVETLLDLSSGGFRIIGVFGMGGIGKTTLAKLIFNQHCSTFPGCCSFLANVRENLESKRLLELQRQLCKDILSPSFASSIHDPNDGINKIKKGLENKKVLLVLDDMDSPSQLADLVGHHVSFSSGSRIIITTRNKRTLDVLKQDMELLAYEMKEMKYDQAIKLFSRNAFRRDIPPKEFQILSMQVVSYIKGLPLVLEVFGSSLCGRSKEEWEEKLEELKNIPNKSIQNRLMISYQGLKSNQQKIFLDIACYRGELKKMQACYMWKDCGLFPKSAIQVLKDNCLIKVIDYPSDDETFWMHDVLKDLGRALIQEESSKRNGILSRLHINKSLDILHEEKEKACLETLSIVDATMTREDMAGLSRLRFLELRRCKMMGSLEGLFPNLRWLSLTDVSNFSLVSFNPQHLVVLSVSGNNVNSFWKEWSLKKADQLKVLDLNSCFMMEMPFKKSSSLEVLVLNDCRYLTEFSTSNIDFKNLTHLIIRNMSLRDYSIDCIGNFTSLCKLDLFHMDITELPDSIGHLQQLKELRAGSCYHLRRVPGLPSSLTHLYITSLVDTMQVCWSSQLKLTNMIELEVSCECFRPMEGKYLSVEWIASATNLEKLCLQIPYILTGLEKVAELSWLKHLEVSFAKFQDLQHLPFSLSRLELHKCELSSGILDVSNLKNLKNLKISHDDKLEEIKGLGELHSLLLYACPSLERLPNFSGLKSLEDVYICSCNSLELSSANLSRLENAQNMSVDIIYCNKLPRVHRRP